jgi:hypothetical protein
MPTLLIKILRTGLICAAITGGSLIWYATQKPDLTVVNIRDAFESELGEANAALIRVEYDLGDVVSKHIRFDRQTLARHPLYLKNPASDDDFTVVGSDGTVSRSGLTVPLKWQGGAELVVTRKRQTLFLGTHPLRENFAEWEVYWVSRDHLPPTLETADGTPFDMYDGFMRENLTGSKWKTSSGQWTLKKFGGGAPTTEAQAESIDFQRAVNAFALTGSGGVLTYEDDIGSHSHAEACFFFGSIQNSRQELDQLPASDMQVILGELDGLHVSFGWVAAEGAFRLRSRNGDGVWTTLGGLDNWRPAVSNWAKIAIELENGYFVRGMLDGKTVVEMPLRTRLSGAMHLMVGAEPVLIDDVRVWTLPKPGERAAPVFVKSRNFAGKDDKPKSDPEQFGQWARSEDIFTYGTATDEKGVMWRGMTTRRPLFGDFDYESVPFHADAGDLPVGDYTIEILPAPESSVGVPPAAMAFTASRSKDGWTSAHPAWPAGQQEFTLRLRRQAGELSLHAGGKWHVLGILEGACRVRVGRAYAEKITMVSPRPEHHMIRCANLVNEFFEEAPTDWAWVDGRFRMDIRWACQNQWNFMACDSTEVPYMTSRRLFEGDQEHEFYMSLRPLIDRAVGWYVRRDISFSFCTDGRNPMSGYAVVLGAENNTKSMLLRKGEVVAVTPKFLVPGGVAIQNVHWKWWNFEVHKYGKKITVLLDDKVMFEYEDPEPIEGGHVGFWSVRNGFTMSRYIGKAERIGYDSDVLYVGNDTRSDDWQPLLRDSVTLTAENGERHTRVTPTVGAGRQAVRHIFDPPVDIATKSTLTLPLEIAESAKLNVYAQISGVPYVIPLTSPLSKMRGMPTPAFDLKESYHSNYLPESLLKRRRLTHFAHKNGRLFVNLKRSLSDLGVALDRAMLESLTIGNSSNAGYLMAGAWGNTTASSYAVGTPELIETLITGWAIMDWGSPGELKTFPNETRVVVESPPDSTIDKAAVAVTLKEDLSKREQLLFSMDNLDSSTQAGIALAIKTTDDHVYYELPIQTIGPGRSRELVFKLQSSDWKSEATGWKHTGRLGNADQARKLIVLVYHHGKGCTVNLDDVVIR